MDLSPSGETKEVMWQFTKDPRYWDLAQTTINATGNFKIVFEGSATWPTTGKLIMKLFGQVCKFLCDQNEHMLTQRLCDDTVCLHQNRRQKVFNRGLCVGAGWLDTLKIGKNSTDL